MNEKFLDIRVFKGPIKSWSIHKRGQSSARLRVRKAGGKIESYPKVNDMLQELIWTPCTYHCGSTLIFISLVLENCTNRSYRNGRGSALILIGHQAILRERRTIEKVAFFSSEDLSQVIHKTWPFSLFSPW